MTEPSLEMVFRALRSPPIDKIHRICMFASFPRYVIAVLAVASLFAGIGGALYAQSSVIEGTARDAETGEPISYLNVVARGESDWFGASANDEGQFRIAGLPAGAYLVQATAIGYDSAEQRVQVEAGATRSVTFELTPQAYDLNEVVVLAEDGQSASATTIHRVPAAAIERQDAADVSELAKLIPATHVATNSRGQTILYFRNAGDRQVGQFFDGALVNVPWDNRVDISLFPAGVIESVTAAKGVVPVQYGTNVIGGAINFQSRTLSSSEIEGDAGRTTEVSGQLGTAAHRQASVVHLGRTGRWDYTAAVQYTERGDQPLPADADLPFSQPSEDRRVNTGRQLVSGFARGSYRFEGGGQLAVTAMHVDAEQGVAPESHLNPALTGVRYWQYPRWQKSMVVASGSAPLGAQASIRGAAWGSRFAQDIHQFQTVAYEDLNEVQDDRDWTGGLRLVGTRGLPVGALTLSINGLTTRHEQTNVLFDAGAPLPDSVSSFRQHIYSVGGEYEVGLTPRLTTTVGVSLDGSVMVDTGPFPDRDPFSAVGVTAGFTYDLSETYRLRLSGGRKGRFPTMRELYGGALGKFVPNPALKPVTAWIGEAGLERRGTHLSGTATIFLNRVTDAIDQRTFQSGPNQGREQRINLDGSRVYGVEATARWKASDALLVDGHVMWAEPRGISGDETQPLDEKPEWLGTGTVTYDLPVGLSLMAQARYVGGTQTRNEQNEYVELPNSLVLDLRAGYAIDSWVRPLSGTELFVRVDNVFDEARFLQLGLPGPGRLIRAGINLSF